jgi:hypothetical protein
LPGVTPVVVPPVPGTQTTTFDIPGLPGIVAKGISPSGSPIVLSINAAPQTVARSQPSWFSGSTSIAGAAIPNVALAGGMGLLLVMLAKKGKR